ncbi:hypothetical protein GSB9_00654 [Flavobacteriaceae bacterium GSB9]|nr:hypothetical protein GSB9_00654 [Flavobacteriaceae bacterium GSB9]
METKTYKLNFKSVVSLLKANLAVILLVYILLEYFNQEIDNYKVILIVSIYFIALYNGPAIYLLFNYYKNNKDTEFSIDEKLRVITITERENQKIYNFEDVKYSIYNIGIYYKNAIDKNFRIPTLFSEFGYWDLTFKNGDRYFLTTLLHDFLLDEDKVKNTKYRFRLIPYIDKKHKDNGVDLKPIKTHNKICSDKLRRNFNQKTIEELNYIIENKSKYQPKAVFLAKKIIKERTLS